MRFSSALSLILAVVGTHVAARSTPNRRNADAAPPGPAVERRCATNAECLQRGLPINAPRPRSRMGRGGTRVVKRGTLSSPPPATGSTSPTITYNYEGVPRTFTPTMDGTYFIQAVGGYGGNTGPTTGFIGGKSALAEVSVFLRAGVDVTIVVGQRGQGAVEEYGGGGGGGSYVFIGTDYIAVAGGGGGASSDSNGLDASLIAAGTNGIGAQAGSGGIGRAGGAGGGGGGGAGFDSAGTGPVTDALSGFGGQSRVNANPFAGGLGGRSRTDIRGGYGGGGGAYDFSGESDGGGGGGVAGGGGGGGTSAGGGGGGGGTDVAITFNMMATGNQRRDLYDVPGDGLVLITRI